MKCPICGKEYDRLLALSRKDNETMICDSCGMQEAIEDFENYSQKTKEEKNYVNG